MGQNESKEIQQNVQHLERENSIQHAQAQKFLHDYHTNDPAVDDVKTFDNNKLKMFLKYFIMEKYPGRTLDKQSTKRAKTNQSAASNEDKNLDNLVGTLCFETYRLDENIIKVYQLISSFILTPTQSAFGIVLKEILKILGVKQCCIMVLNKANVQELKISYNQQKQLLTIKQKGLQQSPYPRSQKYRFRKVQKPQLIKQRFILEEEQLQSTIFYVQQTPTKDRSSTLIISFQQAKFMQANSDKTQLKNLIEKFSSSIGEFLIRMAHLSHFQQNCNDQFPLNTNMSIKDSSQQNQNQVAEICWSLLKIYKNCYDFQHAYFVEKIKTENKRFLKSAQNQISFRQIKLQILDQFKDQTDQGETQDQIVDFLNQYERKHSSIKNDLTEYLQQYFQAITKDILEFQFDSNTELKVLVSSRQVKQNAEIMNNIRQIILKGNTPSLLDIFKQQKEVQQFYKKSYQEALKQKKNQKQYEHDGVTLQFKFNEETLENIKIKVSLEVLAQKHKLSPKSLHYHHVKKECPKKRFSEFHNDGENEDQTNKQNMLEINTINEKDTSLIRISVRSSSNKNLSILDLTSQMQHGLTEFDLLDTNLNILQIERPRQLKMAYNIMNELSFIKQKHPEPSQKLINFLQQLREGYEQNNNPFHNFTHGVNVMHTAFLFTNISKMNDFLSDFTKFALVLSALCHDVGHTGFNNAFQVASNSYLAEMFNDMSPLQNYHISRTFAIMKNDECNFLDFLSKDQKIKLRKLMISNILNTDMKEHFNVLKKYEQKKNTFKKDDLEDEKIICGMLIHSSDFGGSTKEFSICKQWSRLVNEEFMNQSRRQAELGLPLSPFMLNLDKQTIMAKNELGFLKFMVQPLYKSISQSFSADPISGSMIKNLNNNIESWQATIKTLTV